MIFVHGDRIQQAKEIKLREQANMSAALACKIFPFVLVTKVVVGYDEVFST